jgi:hypothetical protein
LTIFLYGILTLSDQAFQPVRVIVAGLVLVLQPQPRVAERLVWALPGSLATTAGISVDFLSSGY